MASKRIGDVSNILAKITNSDVASHGKRAACDAVYVTEEVLKSTGKAVWFAGTAFMILVVPLIIEIDREQQLNELEFQQARN